MQPSLAPAYLYTTLQEAEAAAEALRRAGFDAAQLSLLGRGTPQGVPAAGMGALAAALAQVGVPQDEHDSYEAAVQDGQLLLMVFGDADAVARARGVLATVWPLA